jgi:hypothetical protein
MSPFAHLLGEPIPPLTANLPKRVHHLGDAVDHDELLDEPVPRATPAPRPPAAPVIAGGAPLQIPELGKEQQEPRLVGCAMIVYEPLTMSLIGPNGMTTVQVALPRIVHAGAWVWKLPPVEEDSPAQEPRLLKPEPTPGPKAYRVPAPVPRAPMTYPEAVLIRERSRNRQPVTAADLLEANRVVQETRARNRGQGA